MAKRTLSDLPARLKVGYVDYKIENWPHDQADSAERYGETDRVRRIIRIDTNYGPHQTAETLFHEILHCAWGMWNMSQMEKVDEEEIVSSFGKAIATIWRDNPDVFAWIDMNLTATPTEQSIAGTKRRFGDALKSLADK